MLKPWEVIAELESDNSRLFKESVVEREARAGNTEFFHGVRQALDCMITYGIRKVEEKSGDGQGLTPDIFWDVANRLANRALTGNAAITAVNYLRMDAKEAEWNNWYRRILIKDLRCGVSEKTINNVVKKINENYTVPVFSCQLAHDGANHESKVSGRKFVEVKLDGVRVITIVYPSGVVNMYSRNGKELVNFPHIAEQFSAVAAELPEPWVFDGEVMSGSFQDLMKQIHRKENVAASDAVLYLFDVLTLRDFQAGISQRRQIERSTWLKQWFEDKAFLQLLNVRVVENEFVDLDTADGAARFKAINESAIAGGFEGIMIKDPEAGYETKRSVAWLKQKPFIEVTLEVTDVEEGTGKNLGRTGALVCAGTDDGKRITVNVGSGLTDAMRDSIWRDTNSVIGQLVEVRADAITQNQDGTYSLRFPRFKTFRGFNAGEKL